MCYFCQCFTNIACSCNFSFTPGHLVYWWNMAILKHNRQILESSSYGNISPVCSNLTDPGGLAAAQLLQLWVQIPLHSWSCISSVVVCCIRSSLCDEPIICPDESYRVCVCVCVCTCMCVNFVSSRNLNNKVAWAQRGMKHHIKKEKKNLNFSLSY